MTREEQILYWKDSSDDDSRFMERLLGSGDYSWALFIGHLCLEKILKAYYLGSKGDPPPFSHDLVLLAKRAGLELNQETLDFLDLVTSFNIRGRYDDYKNEFKKLATSEFTTDKVYRIKEVREWIRNKL